MLRSVLCSAKLSGVPWERHRYPFSKGPHSIEVHRVGSISAVLPFSTALFSAPLLLTNSVDATIIIVPGTSYVCVVGLYVIAMIVAFSFSRLACGQCQTSATIVVDGLPSSTWSQYFPVGRA